MSETMSEYIECQGGDRSKKVCFSWHILTLTHPHFEKNLCLSDLAAQATICNSRHLMSCRNSPVTAVEARSSFTNLWLLPKWSMQPCTCEKLKESSFTLDSIDWFPKKNDKKSWILPPNLEGSCIFTLRKHGPGVQKQTVNSPYLELLGSQNVHGGSSEDQAKRTLLVVHVRVRSTAKFSTSPETCVWLSETLSNFQRLLKTWDSAICWWVWVWACLGFISAATWVKLGQRNLILANA